MQQIALDIWNAVRTHGFPALLMTCLAVLAWWQLRSDGLGTAVRRLRAELRTGHGRRMVLFLFYACLLLLFTLMARPLNTEPQKYVFTHWLPNGEEKYDDEIYENILLFIPFTGLLLAAEGQRLLRRPTVGSAAGKAAVIALACSAFIEVSQLIFSLGSFQFSDIFYNTLGGALGGLLWYGMHRLKQRLKK